MFTVNIEILEFPDERELFEKYLYVPESKFLLELYHLTFKNVILDYEMFLAFHKNRLQEANHSAYKFGEIINSSYLVLNNFLVQTYSHLIDDEKNLNNVFGTYETGKNKGKDSWANKNSYLLKRISVILGLDLTEEIKEVKYLEILCRNFFSHGWHLLFLNMFIIDTQRVNNYILQYNENFEDDDSIIFMKHNDFHQSEDIKCLRQNLLSSPKPFKETNDLSFFLDNQNYNNFYYLNNNNFIVNTACSRIFLKRFFFNKYSFISKQDKRNNIQNMYIKLLEVTNNREKIINIDSVFKLISSVVKKIDLKISKLPKK